MPHPSPAARHPSPVTRHWLTATVARVDRLPSEQDSTAWGPLQDLWHFDVVERAWERLEATHPIGGRSKFPLATDHLLENTDGVLQYCCLGAAPCYLLFMLTRYIDDVIVSQAVPTHQCTCLNRHERPLEAAMAAAAGPV